jgi:hypothetical protein
LYISGAVQTQLIYNRLIAHTIGNQGGSAHRLIYSRLIMYTTFLMKLGVREMGLEDRELGPELEVNH